MIRIAHVGGWGRNYGDLALQAGQMRVLREDAPEALDFLPIHCQQTWFHDDLIDMINETCDLLMLGGGGMIFHRPEDSSRSGWQFNIALEDLEKIKVPLAVYAIGYNPLHFDELKLLPQRIRLVGEDRGDAGESREGRHQRRDYRQRYRDHRPAQSRLGPRQDLA